ncbi:hypothetical protein [Nannocystis radixulma]|uniref:Uncharacterized protein n=1 Tax=Nannocystis radixulma TaxID=2995305 RepID=A0ABT5BGF6_9BACT|nr:hypothetical protein [Nannocystis radixulma]MDC0672127.1 hypothetical protein [Nannocystis radixulma]
MTASEQFDALLPEVWDNVRKKRPEYEQLWMASADDSWKLKRHEISGAVLQRSAWFGVLERDRAEGYCFFSLFQAIEEHVANGQYTPMRVDNFRDPDSSGYTRSHADCKLATQESYGYRGPSGAEAPPAPAPAETP